MGFKRRPQRFAIERRQKDFMRMLLNTFSPATFVPRRWQRFTIPEPQLWRSGMPGKEYPVVLRFEGMMPADLAGYEAYRLRKGGDLGHVDRQRSGLNNRLLGSTDWAQQAQHEINQMAQEAFAAELEYHECGKDQKAIKKRLAEGPRNPWRSSRHGPLREVILTANKDWFEQTDDSGQLFDDQRKAVREQVFERHAVSWLQKHFGSDVSHARAVRDEQAYHIHAVIMPRTIVRKCGVECRQLQPSIHPMIRDYETAQDSVGQHFAEIGLVRGERRKQVIRDALNNGKEPPAKRRHVRQAKWRQQEELRLANRGGETRNEKAQGGGPRTGDRRRDRLR